RHDLKSEEVTGSAAQFLPAPAHDNRRNRTHDALPRSLQFGNAGFQSCNLVVLGREIILRRPSLRELRKPGFKLGPGPIVPSRFPEAIYVSKRFGVRAPFAYAGCARISRRFGYSTPITKLAFAVAALLFSSGSPARRVVVGPWCDPSLVTEVCYQTGGVKFGV